MRTARSRSSGGYGVPRGIGSSWNLRASTIPGALQEARKDGYDAYGIDLPNMEPYWRKNGNDPSSFFSCSAIRMPFRSNCFDFVWSLGVVEHIGTTSDTATLAADYLQARRGYVSELIRVTKPGGRIVVSCPNRAFPVDLHHGPTCGTHLKQLRWYVFNKTKLNIHKMWGKYHLLSYAEVNRLFLDSKLVDSVSPLPLTSYFGFNNAFRCGYLRHATSLAKAYVEHLPSFLLPTFLNPYVLVMARKEAEQDALHQTRQSRAADLDCWAQVGLCPKSRRT